MVKFYFFQGTGEDIDSEMIPIGGTDFEVDSEECQHTNDDQGNNKGMSWIIIYRCTVLTLEMGRSIGIGIVNLLLKMSLSPGYAVGVYILLISDKSVEVLY